MFQTVFSEVLKGAICDANGVQELLSIIERVKFEDRDAAEATEPALCAIRHLTNNHKKAEDVQRMLIYNLQVRIKRIFDSNKWFSDWQLDLINYILIF